ncbi:MAG: sigma-70 family RNA polymerase sigma factor [Candidatus Asgardarchaeia archaeon]
MEKQKIHNLDLWIRFKKEKNEKKKGNLKNELIEIYYPLVQKISYKFAKNLRWKVLPEELTSLGIDGLYSAIDRFCLDAGVDFPTYANRRIGGSMIDGIRKEDIIPRSVRINNNLLEKMKSEMENTKGGKVTDYEVVEKLGINQTEYLKNIKKYKPISFISLEGSDICGKEKQENFKQDSLGDIEDKKTKTPDSTLLRKEFLNKLMSKSFTRMEQKIIYYYYYENLTMEDIARKLNMSESRISQLHTAILPRLRDKIERNPVFFGKDISGYIERCNNNDPLF